MRRSCCAVKHDRRCRPGRPLCRWRRRAAQGAPCHCDVFHFPHRGGSCTKYGGVPKVLYESYVRAGGGGGTPDAA